MQKAVVLILMLACVATVLLVARHKEGLLAAPRWTEWVKVPYDLLLLLAVQNGFRKYVEQNSSIKASCGSDWRFYTSTVMDIRVAKGRYLGASPAAPADPQPANSIDERVVAVYCMHPCFGGAKPGVTQNPNSVQTYVNQGRWQKVGLNIYARRRNPGPGKTRTPLEIVGLKVFAEPVQFFMMVGPRTGSFLMELPVIDLKMPKAGVWNARLDPDFKTAEVLAVKSEAVLRVKYEAGSGSSGAKQPGKNGGFVLSQCIPKILPVDALVLSFDVMFETGWDFSRGGKLLGIMVGFGDASGKEHSSTGASHRVNFQSEGAAVSYIYPPAGVPQEDPNLVADGGGIKYFYDLFPPGTLKINEFNHIEMGVKLNTFASDGSPNADGGAALTINGKTGELSNIRWRKSVDLRITEVLFNTFFGGSTPSLATCYAQFKNFKLHDWQS